MSERYFFSLRLPEHIVDELVASQDVIRRVAPNAVMIPRESLALPIIDLEDVDAATFGLAQEAGVATTQYNSPFSLRLGELGCFPRGLEICGWRNVVQSALLKKLYQTLGNHLEHRGVHFDDKPFVPSVTIARKVELAANVDQHAFLADPDSFIPTKPHQLGSTEPFEVDTLVLCRATSEDEDVVEHLEELATFELGSALR